MLMQHIVGLHDKAESIPDQRQTVAARDMAQVLVVLVTGAFGYSKFHGDLGVVNYELIVVSLAFCFTSWQ